MKGCPYHEVSASGQRGPESSGNHLPDGSEEVKGQKREDLSCRHSAVHQQMGCSSLSSVCNSPAVNEVCSFGLTQKDEPLLHAGGGGGPHAVRAHNTAGMERRNGGGDTAELVVRL